MNNKKFQFVIDSHNLIVKSHFVYDKMVLPGVCYLDVLARAYKKENLILNNIIFKNPTIIEEGEAITVEIQSDSRMLRISSQEIDSGRKGYLEAEFEESQGDVNIIKKTCPDFNGISQDARSLSDFYHLAESSGIVHKEFMRNEGSFFKTQDTVILKLQLSASAKPFIPEFYFHPALLDGATFSLGVLYEEKINREDHQFLYVPFYIKQFVSFDFLRADSCFVVAEKIQSKDDELMGANIFIFNEQKKLCLIFENFTNKRISRKNDFKKLALTSEPIGYSDRVEDLNERDDGGDFKFQVSEIVRQYLNNKDIIISDTMSFFDLGLDSNSLIELALVFEKTYQLKLYPTLLFDYNSVRKLANYLQTRRSQTRVIEPNDAASNAIEWKLYSPEWEFEKTLVQADPKSTLLLHSLSYSINPYIESRGVKIIHLTSLDVAKKSSLDTVMVMDHLDSDWPIKSDMPCFERLQNFINSFGRTKNKKLHYMLFAPSQPNAFPEIYTIAAFSKSLIQELPLLPLFHSGPPRACRYHELQYN